jgi:hypothetical protein
MLLPSLVDAAAILILAVTGQGLRTLHAGRLDISCRGYPPPPKLVSRAVRFKVQGHHRTREADHTEQPGTNQPILDRSWRREGHYNHQTLTTTQNAIERWLE